MTAEIGYDLPGLRDSAGLEPLGGLDGIGATVVEDHGPGTAITVHGLQPMTLPEADFVAAEVNTHGDPTRHAVAVMLVPAHLYRQLRDLDRQVHPLYHEVAAEARHAGVDEPTVGQGIGPGVVAEFARRYAAGQVPRTGYPLGGDAA